MIRSNMSMSRSITALLGCVVLTALSGNVAAQTANNMVANDASGLQVSVGKISKSGNDKVSVQLMLKNTAKQRVYLLVFGASRLATDTGQVGELPNNAEAVVGINSCSRDGDDARAYKNCLTEKGEDLNNYSYIEPGQFTTVSMTYRGINKLDVANSISFAFKAIARMSLSGEDPLSADSQKVSAPKTINVNLPMLPLK